MKRRDFLKSASAAGGQRRASGARDLLARQGAGAPGNPADRLGERAEQHRHPWRRHQRARLRGVVELLRPPDQPRDEDRAERRSVLRPRQVQDGARRRHERRRHVGHLQAEEERDLPGRLAGDGERREVVARPRRHGRRLSDLPDGRGLAHQGGAVRRGGRQHGARRLRQEGPADHPRSRRDRAGDLQLRAGQVEGQRERPVGPRIHQAEHGRLGRLSRGELDRRHRSRDGAQRQMGRRAAAEGAAHRVAHGAVGRQPARAAGARRRGHFLRSAEQGFRRAEGRRQAQHRVDAVLERHPVHRHEREAAAVR